MKNFIKKSVSNVNTIVVTLLKVVFKSENGGAGGSQYTAIFRRLLDFENLDIRTTVWNFFEAKNTFFKKCLDNGLVSEKKIHYFFFTVEGGVRLCNDFVLALRIERGIEVTWPAVATAQARAADCRLILVLPIIWVWRVKWNISCKWPPLPQFQKEVVRNPPDTDVCPDHLGFYLSLSLLASLPDQVSF